jgi:anti-anti-sigma factor
MHGVHLTMFFRVAGPIGPTRARENDMTATSILPPGGRVILRLRDALDIEGAPRLRERLIGVLRRGPGLLILDLSGVPSCDVVGLAVLIGTQRRARQLGIEVRLAAPSLPVAKVLCSTGLDRSFTICRDPSGALASEFPLPASAARSALVSGIAV